MPRIFDNIALTLLPDLQKAIEASFRAHFGIGYFDMRRQKQLTSQLES
jgi:hypothetical protein